METIFASATQLIRNGCGIIVIWSFSSTGSTGMIQGNIVPTSVTVVIVGVPTDRMLLVRMSSGSSHIVIVPFVFLLFCFVATDGGVATAAAAAAARRVAIST